MIRRTASAVCFCIALTPATGWTGLYKCLDKDQKPVYQDRPCQEMTSAQLSPALERLAPSATQRHLLWKATKEKATLYLLAGLGFGSDTMYPLPEAITDVVATAQVLVVAPELRDASRSDAEVLAKGAGKYSDSTTLSAHVKPATWERVLATATSLGISEEAIAPEKPWLAALTLKSASLKRMGYDQSLSLAKSLIQSTGSTKPIIELDPLDKQLATYDQLSQTDQEQWLLSILAELDERNGTNAAFADAWKSGDAEAIALVQRRLVDSLGSARNVMERAFDNRNDGIAAKLEELSADGRTYFAVVAPGRLISESGLISRLEKKGFNLSQL